MSSMATRPWVFPALLWLLVVIAPLPILGKSTSVGLHVAVLPLLAAWLLIRDTGRGVAAGWLLAFVGVILAHTMATIYASPCRDMLARSVSSGLLLMVLVASLAVCARTAAQEQGNVGVTLAAIILTVLASVVINKGWLLATNASPLIRPSGLFDEPSHLALGCAPVLAALVVAQKRIHRWIGWVSTVAMVTLAASATLFVLFSACMAITLITASRRGRVGRLLAQLFAASSVAVLLVMVSPFRQDFIDRVTGLGAISVESNVSSLIYLNGLQTAIANLEITQGLGLGANRMGCEPRPVTDVTGILESFDLADFNYNDGSFTAAKLFSEFGLLAIVWLLLAGAALLHAVRMGRKQYAPESRMQFALAAAALLVVTVGAFVRGTGYFSGPFLMGVFFCFWLQQKSRSQRNQPHGQDAHQA